MKNIPFLRKQYFKNIPFLLKRYFKNIPFSPNQYFFYAYGVLEKQKVGYLSTFSEQKTSPLGEVLFLSMFGVEGKSDSAWAAMCASGWVAWDLLNLKVFSEFGS